MWKITIEQSFEDMPELNHKIQYETHKENFYDILNETVLLFVSMGFQYNTINQSIVELAEAMEVANENND